ncbi:serine/threonine-protein kinase ppk6-like [Pimephales promelas]|nr:serine/threonine-protein kinase ppk6-like [Pimephales promelas]
MQKVNIMHATLHKDMDDSSDMFFDAYEYFPEDMDDSCAQPSTSTAVLSEGKPNSPTDTSTPNNPSGTFDSLYEVGKKLKWGSDGTIREGIRRSDGTPVVIKFVKKRESDNSIELAGHSKPVCKEAFIMQMLEQSDHVVKLQDWFDVEDRNILIMEYPQTSMTLSDFIKRCGGRLTESPAKEIMQKIIVAIKDFSKWGVYHNDISLRNVLIIPYTMQIKFIGFGRALTISESRKFKPTSRTERAYRAVIAASEDLYKVLKGMVKGKGGLKRWFSCRKVVLSKEYQDLLQSLRDREPGIILQNILDHDWFNNMLYESESSDGPSFLHGAKPTPELEHFQSLYKVGKKLEYGDHVYEGVRRSDGLKVCCSFSLTKHFVSCFLL